MADKDYRSFIGRVYAGPFERTVTTQNGAKELTEYYTSGPGMNSDVEIKLTFWDDVPEYVETGVILFVSGSFSTYEGKDKDGNAKTTKSIAVNFCEKLGQNTLVRSGGKPAAPKKRPPVKTPADDDDFDF